MENKLEYRMYGLVPYNISKIQQGIQYGHALQEYNNKIQDVMYSNQLNVDKIDISSFLQWSKEDKTFIILNGGTTNKRYLKNPILKENECTLYFEGSLNNNLEKLKYNKVETAVFYEPDLGDQLTAVVFLVDERVYDKEKYPDRNLGGTFRPILSSFIPAVYHVPETEEAFEKRVGGKQNVWMREFLKQFRLA